MNVIRDGDIENIESTELVVGDLVEIAEGMEIPADGWVTKSNDIKADESLITGENDSVAKDTFENAKKKKSEGGGNGGQKDKGQEKEGGDDKDAMSYRLVPSPILLSGSGVWNFRYY